MRSSGICILVVLSVLLGKTSARKLFAQEETSLRDVAQAAINKEAFLKLDLHEKYIWSIITIWFEFLRGDKKDINAERLLQGWQRLVTGCTCQYADAFEAIKQVEKVARGDEDEKLTLEEVSDYVFNARGPVQMARLRILLIGY